MQKFCFCHPCATSALLPLYRTATQFLRNKIPPPSRTPHPSSELYNGFVVLDNMSAPEHRLLPCLFRFSRLSRVAAQNTFLRRSRKSCRRHGDDRWNLRPRLRQQQSASCGGIMVGGKGGLLWATWQERLRHSGAKMEARCNIFGGRGGGCWYGFEDLAATSIHLNMRSRVQFCPWHHHSSSFLIHSQSHIYVSFQTPHIQSQLLNLSFLSQAFM